MGGDAHEGPDAASMIEELGSVGDWRLPSWMPHSGLAWLFIVLAILFPAAVLWQWPPAAGPLVVAPSGDPNPISDVAVAVYRSVSAATPLLTIGSWVLLLAAFARGLGTPATGEPDAYEGIELDPVPTPG